MKLLRAAAWNCIVLLACGCSASPRPYTHRIPFDRDDRFSDEPRSALFDGKGLDAIALEVGRSHWPSAPRDVFEGERTTYYEYFLDIEGTPWGQFWGDNNFTWRQFRSDRIGSLRR